MRLNYCIDLTLMCIKIQHTFKSLKTIKSPTACFTVGPSRGKLRCALGAGDAAASHSKDFVVEID